MKIHEPDKVEVLDIFLNEYKYPVAFKTKLEELMEMGETEEEARKILSTTPIQMEVYYEKNYGLFLVESEAIEGGAEIYSPYTQHELEPSEE